jgi:hypothetical protein
VDQEKFRHICDPVPNGVSGISFPKSCHILRRNSPNLQETWRNNRFVGKKFLNFKKWGNEYCHHAWRPWREAKSCSTGDRPPTHYFNTGHKPGFGFLDAHFSTHKPPALALALALIPFVTAPMLMGHKIRCSHGICKLHMKQCWKWGVEIHHFHFVSNIF